jgi:site-specific recombinase XerC
MTGTAPSRGAGIRCVKGEKRLGVRVGNWLSAEQGKTLVAAPSGLQPRNVRNRAVLATLIGCGLRRAKFVTVRVEDFQLRENHWVLVNLIGKGGHMRTVPIPAWVKSVVDAWDNAQTCRTDSLSSYWKDQEHRPAIHGTRYISHRPRIAL